jgi:uncharacterized protein YyaL (SSP411 family)
MERESFEDEATAKVLNSHFVSIKVDREERPDVDAIYMEAVQALTQRGGWPMSVFLTPDGEPFYGGTYFPNADRYGMPSFTKILARIAELWERDRLGLIEAGGRLTAALAQTHSAGTSSSGGAGPVDFPDAGAGIAVPGRVRAASGTLDAATRALVRSFDSVNGGWGGAPKFPQPSIAEFVLRRHLATGDRRLLALVTQTLDAMARGGIYDQLGGGFHRYATDAIWLVPHFEKMLYDNAQLARLYLHAWQVTGNELYRRVAVETLDYMAREMRDEGGGFYSSQDADTEGREGAFFVWTPDEIAAVAARTCENPAADAELFMATYGVTPGGNFEGSSVLHSAQDVAGPAGARRTASERAEARLLRLREALADERARRAKPGLDDKILASWNGLALGAFAEAARTLGRADYLVIAERNAAFVLAEMRTEDGRLLRTWKGGRARLNGYLEDQSHYADGLLELYQATFEPRWFDAARELGDAILSHFADPAGGFFDTSDDHEALLLRPKSVQDGAVPSGGAAAAGVLLRLGAYTDDSRYADAAEAALAPLEPLMAGAPHALAHWLGALDFLDGPPQTLAIVGEDPGALLTVVRARYRPNLVVAAEHAKAGAAHEPEAAAEPDVAASIALLADRDAVRGRATAYLCRRFTCEAPVSSPEELAGLLDRSSQGG